MRRSRKAPRGFSLLEALMAGAIFVTGVLSVTALSVMTAQRGGYASKRASTARIVSQEYARIARQGYDYVDAGGPFAPYTVLDPDGREVSVSGFIGPDCNSAPGDGGVGTNLAQPDGGLSPSPSQACCPGNICCKVVRLDASWRDTSRSGSPTIGESYVGFLTKSCP